LREISKYLFSFFIIIKNLLNKLMKILFQIGLVLLFMNSTFSQTNYEIKDSSLYKRAIELCKSSLLIDTHIDLPDWLYDGWFDISQEINKGEIDYVRAIKGGLNLPFMSIYTSPSLEGTGKSKIKADSMISLVYKIVDTWPNKFCFIKSTSEINKNLNQNKILLTMGMENGSPIENNINNLEEFYNNGIRYITLAHFKSNHISDSANDPDRKWNGLSPFGEEVVKEMNRLGIMVDVSHISDSSFYDVIRLSKAPVIASHSCCRFFVPSLERNMSDEMIKILAAHNGVIQINFANFYLRNDIYQQFTNGENVIKEHLKEFNITEGSDSANIYENNYWKENPLTKATVQDVADHIDHVKNLVGIDYIGIGSDFNGTGGLLPIGLENVSKYPNLVYELLLRGYNDNDIKKVLGGNLLRVWKKAEDVSAQLRK
jgi:membrane dipeptidase